MHKSLNKYFPVFVLPTLIAFLLAFVTPFVMGFTLSFAKYKTLRWDLIEWVGFDNYTRLIDDNAFMSSLKFTVLFTIVTVIVINVIAFLLAVLLTGRVFGTNFFRTVFFMPNLIGGIVLGYIWQIILNAVIDAINGKTLLENATYGFWGLVAVMVWQMAGYMMIIYIAGIQNVPGELIEAAKIDGASKFQILRKVTIPMVMPSITICLFLTLSNSFKLFDQNLSLTAGYPLSMKGGIKETALIALNIFTEYSGRGKVKGYAQAQAVVFFIFVALISLVQLVATRRKEVQS